MTKRVFSDISRKAIKIIPIILIAFSTSIIAQEKKLDTNNASKSIPTELLQILKDKEQVLRIAQLELQNTELQIRLLLGIPNDYIRIGDKFEKPPQGKKDDKKNSP